MLTQVVETGQATRSRDLLLLMNRDGFEEETYFSFSYSPIRDELGGVGGVFTPVLETTGKVVGERRLRTLRELAALGGADSVARAAADAASVLAQADKDIPFAAIYKLDGSASRAALLAAAGVAAGSPSAPFEIEMAPGLRPAVWPLGRMCEVGLTIRIDAQDDVAILPTGAWDDPPNTVLLIPIFAATQDAPIAALVAGAIPSARSTTTPRLLRTRRQADRQFLRRRDGAGGGAKARRRPCGTGSGQDPLLLECQP